MASGALVPASAQLLACARAPGIHRRTLRSHLEGSVGRGQTRYYAVCLSFPHFHGGQARNSKQPLTSRNVPSSRNAAQSGQWSEIRQA